MIHSTTAVPREVRRRRQLPSLARALFENFYKVAFVAIHLAAVPAGCAIEVVQDFELPVGALDALDGGVGAPQGKSRYRTETKGKENRSSKDDAKRTTDTHGAVSGERLRHCAKGDNCSGFCMSARPS